MARKPSWGDRQGTRASGRPAAETLWLFGAARGARRLGEPGSATSCGSWVTRKAADKLAEAIAGGAAGLDPEIADPRKFPVGARSGVGHRGCGRWRCGRFDWGTLQDVGDAPWRRPLRLVLLDRSATPITWAPSSGRPKCSAPRPSSPSARHSAPETGALARTASGALERQPLPFGCPNLGNAIRDVEGDGLYRSGPRRRERGRDLRAGLHPHRPPVALVLGAEGPACGNARGPLCNHLVRIPCVRCLRLAQCLGMRRRCSLYAVTRPGK